MKLLFHTVVLLFINVFSIYGQKGTDENAHYEIFRPSKGTEPVIGDVVGFNGSSYFSCQPKGRDATYFEFSNDYKQVKKNEIIVPKSKIGVNIEFHFQLGDRIYEGYSTTDKATKTNKLLYRTLNVESLNHEENGVEIFSLIGDAFYGNFRNAFSQVNVSPNGEYVLMALKLPEDSDKHKKFHFMVFDRQLKLQWEKDVSFFIEEDKEFSVLDKNWAVPYIPGATASTNDNGENYHAFKVGNHGEVVTWGSQKTKIPKERWAYTKDYFAFVVTKDATHQTKLEFDKPVADYIIQPSPSGLVRIAGFYFTKDTDKEDGAFVSYWDFEKGSSPDTRFYPFSDEFRNLYKKKGKLPGYFNGFTYTTDAFLVDNLLDTKDGGLILTGGLKYIYVNNNIAKTVTGSIVIVSINPTGTLNWMRKIPKFQETFIGTYAGYEMAYAKDKLYFLYNDNFKNLTKAITAESIETFVKGDNPVVLAVCDLTNDGEISRQKVWTTDEAGGMYEPGKKLSFMNENGMVVPLQIGYGAQKPIAVVQFK